MVRAVVGTLVEVGRGKMTVDEFRKVIEDKDRCSAGSSVQDMPCFGRCGISGRTVYCFSVRYFQYLTGISCRCFLGFQRSLMQMDLKYVFQSF